MNYLVSGSSLVLFALFYQMSGGAEFVPQSEQPIEVAAAQSDPMSRFTVRPVPFQSPIITDAPKPQATTSLPALAEASSAVEGFEIVRASTRVEQVETDTNPRADIRIVAGEWVNMRSGPGTSYDVLTTLPQGVEAEIIQVNDADWAQIRLLDRNETGWMAAWLLSD